MFAKIKNLPFLWWLLLVWGISVPVKWIAAHNMGWDIDFIPVIAQGLRWLEGGAFPAYGTLSSVAAYNMPFLVWLHLPALVITRDPYWTMLLTLLVWNALGTVYAYRAGTLLLDERVGLLAAVLFTFSEVGVSSSYTAWAQLLLPTFYLIVWVHLWLWRSTERGIHLALAGSVATAAFMTHFSAILLYGAMLLFALITRARWQPRWFIGGGLACLVLLAPYLSFEAQRDFVDLRAFITRQSLIPAEIKAEYEHYGYSAEPAETTSPLSPAMIVPANANNPTPPSREMRALFFLLDIPQQTLQGFVLFANTSYGMFNTVLVMLLGCAIGLAVYRLGQRWWYYTTIPERLVQSDGGRALLLVGFCLVLIEGLILTRATPLGQATYYLSLVGLQCVLVAYGAVVLLDANLGASHDSPLPRWRMALLLLFAVGYGLAQSTDRIQRIVQYDDTVYSVQNVWLYRHIAATTDYIAVDWGQQPIAPVIAYDLLPDMPTFWWIPAWYTIDPLYRLGTPYDFLLATKHGMVNPNQDPIGTAATPDYIVTYTIGLVRYDLAQYEQARFGTIVVLKPLAP